MKFKKIFLLICLIICLFAMASVCAANANDTAMASEDTGLELSADNEMDVDNLQTNEENHTLAVGDNDEAVSVETDSEILTDGQYTYSDLSDQIGSGGNKNLTKGTYTYNENDGDTIQITDSGVIDGNGAIIDMAGFNKQAFEVVASDVTIKNLTIKNVNYTGESEGGAIFFFGGGTVLNCNFTSNKVAGDYIDGGAIYFFKEGNVANCNFTNNSAYRGGAIYFFKEGNVTNCYFEDNSANTGGAIFSNVKYAVAADTCIFKTSSDTTENIDIYPPTLNVDNFITVYGSGEKLAFDLKTNSNIPVTNGNISISVYYKNNDSWVGNYSCLSGEEWAVDLPVGFYYAIFNTKYAEFEPITRTIKIIPNIKYYANVTSLTTNNKTVNITATSNMPQDILGGKLLFIISNNEEISANYTGNGTWWALHTFDDYTTYQVNATYVGLDNVTINNATVSISRANSTLTVGDVVFDYNSVGSTTVSFTGASGVNASVVDQPNAKVSVAGNVIKVSGLNVGTYNLTVTTIADADHISISKTVKITVNKLKTSVSGVKVTAAYGISKNLVITLKDVKGNRLAGKYVTVVLGKTAYKNKITNSKGQITIAVPKNLVPKTYAASITFDGDRNYAKSTSSVNVEVKKATPKITAKAKKFKKSVKTKKYTVTLKTNLNKPMKNTWVILKVNKKTYKVKTNKYGKATFKIKNLKKKGTYKATVTYKGNKYYKKVTKKNVKIIVK